MAAGQRRGIWAVLGMALLALSACGDALGEREGFGPGGVPIANFTPQQIFERGEFEMARNRATRAAYFFSEIERLYPYSDWAKRALIMEAFAHHQAREYEESRSAAQRYVDFYPADEDAAYAQYLLALSYYDQIEEVGRDQGLTFQALQELNRVIELYPESDYARSAIAKFDLAFDHLAAKEMEIGRYYLRQQHYGAAINRFRSVVEDYQTSTHTAEALHRLVEAYLSLGLTQQAQAAGAILGYNYGETTWYADSYALLTGQGLELSAAGDGWLAQIYRQMLQGKWL